MIDRTQGIFILFEEHAVFLRNLEIGLDQPHSGNPSQTNDHPRADQADLLPKIFNAGVLLLRQRIPIGRRPAFQNIGYVDLLPGDAHGAQILVQQFSRGTHKGNTDLA